MWKTEKGILLKCIKYSDSNSILKVFTESSGLLTLNLKTYQTKSYSGIRAITGQPLACVEVTYLDNETKNIKPIKSLDLWITFNDIPYNIPKQTILIFINEILLQTIKLPKYDKQLFDFTIKEIETLDKLNTGLSYFPLLFLLNIFKQIGIFPNLPQGDNKVVFDIYEGKFVDKNQTTVASLDENLSKSLKVLLESKNIFQNTLSKSEKKALLDVLVNYYAIHNDFHTEIKSLPVLKMIF